MAHAEPGRSFGVCKPVGHVVISFPGESHARRAAQAPEREDSTLRHRT